MIGGKIADQPEGYVASADLDPVTERYVYSIPATMAPAGGPAPIIQYDVKTKTTQGHRVRGGLLRREVRLGSLSERSGPLSAPMASILFVT